MENNENAGKFDAGKPRVSLVPMQIIRDIAVIREYGNNKYGSADNWKNVERYKFVDALGRHTLHFLENPLSVDEESGLPHLWHAACNTAFLCEMFKEELQGFNELKEVLPVQADEDEEKKKMGRPPSTTKGLLPQISDETLYELYVVKEMTGPEIARAYESDLNSVYNRIRSAGITKENRPPKTDEPKYKIEVYSGGIMVDSYETDAVNKAGIYYDGELRKGNGVRLYIKGERKSIAESERIFKPYLKKNENVALIE